MGIWYATREDVKSALDLKETARDNSQVDRAIEGSSRSIEGSLNRVFYPTTATRYFDYPRDSFGPPSWRIWLEQDEIISLASITSGGVPVSTANVFLEPINDGPPYDRIELNRNSSAAFGQGSTPQRDIAITGQFGGHIDDSALAGMLAADINNVNTSITVTNSAVTGVGDVLVIGSERIVINGKSQLTTSQTNLNVLTQSAADNVITVLDGSQYNVNEVLTLDAERMLIVDITGNSLIVKRVWDGTVLQSHTGATIYASRTLLVTRAALGTTAVPHSAMTIYKQAYPGIIRDLCIAESINRILQETSGYARVVGSGETVRNASGAGLADIRAQAYESYGRKLRLRSV